MHGFYFLLGYHAYMHGRITSIKLDFQNPAIEYALHMMDSQKKIRGGGADELELCKVALRAETC